MQGIFLTLLSSNRPDSLVTGSTCIVLSTQTSFTNTCLLCYLSRGLGELLLRLEKAFLTLTHPSEQAPDSSVR